MWSGPRNISTAMMRSFENRPDAIVVDEPFYGAYLAETGLNHPMREEILAAHETDWQKIIDSLLAPLPAGRTVFYQKQMPHHMVVDIGDEWLDPLRHAFLIRSPEAVLASYSIKHAEVGLSDIGFVEQATMFERIAERTGKAPPVILGRDVLENPRAALTALCGTLGIPFREEMLAWPAGRRNTDGVWAAHWYGSVEASTGFAPPMPEAGYDDLDDRLKAIADEARPYFERLAAYRIQV
ncbi:MAG: sulfotransferase family protein [Hyphomicrobiales bacterium]|nr:MAG: sulfotransferase family protein [Hyphomicrobiales bacterium]